MNAGSVYTLLTSTMCSQRRGPQEPQSLNHADSRRERPRLISMERAALSHGSSRISHHPATAIVQRTKVLKDKGWLACGTYGHAVSVFTAAAPFAWRITRSPRLIWEGAVARRKKGWSMEGIAAILDGPAHDRAASIPAPRRDGPGGSAVYWFDYRGVEGHKRPPIRDHGDIHTTGLRPFELFFGCPLPPSHRIPCACGAPTDGSTKRSFFYASDLDVRKARTLLELSPQYRPFGSAS
jgi:hypothetical protein